MFYFLTKLAVSGATPIVWGCPCPCPMVMRLVIDQPFKLKATSRLKQAGPFLKEGG